MKSSKVLLLVIALSLGVTQLLAQKTFILCREVLDGTGKSIPNAMIVVEGNRITSVGKREKTPTGANVIDLSEYTVLPGFIDMHCHPLGDADDDYQLYHLKNSSAAKALQGLSNVQGMLRAGWTTIRVPRRSGCWLCAF